MFRIVFQQLSIKDKVVCAVYVSPADRELALKDSSEWTAKEVAYRILTDKGSSVRMSKKKERKSRLSLYCFGVASNRWFHDCVKKNWQRLGSGQRIMDDADTLEESKINYKDEVPYYQFEVSRSGTIAFLLFPFLPGKYSIGQVLIS